MNLITLIRLFIKANGRRPSPNELSELQKKAMAPKSADIIKFPEGGRDRVPVNEQFGGIKSLEEFKKAEDAYESTRLRGDETFDELIDPKRIKSSISTKIKSSGPARNRDYAKDLIGGKSKEFNTLKSEDRKELFDLLEAEIKKDMDDIPFADGGRVGFASGKLARLKKKYKGSTLEAILENPKLMGTELGYEGLAEIFRLFGLKEGGPADPKRRQILKIMGGLAALPYVGKFFKLAEPAAKVAPVVKESVTKAPDYFFALVDKIKRFGKSVDDVSVDPRVEKNYTYKNYELKENAYGTPGDITVVKQKGDPDFAYEEEIMTFRKGQADETTKGRKPPDEYDEYTTRPDMDGKMKDVEDGIEPESVQEIVEEVFKKATSIKKADGGLARVLGL